jgi:Sulfotransferase domain
MGTPVRKGPDFFIVGAPKCGTTAMADYLGQHPAIGMCARKETHHLATDLRPRLVVKQNQQRFTREQYLGFFDHVQDRSRLGEASVWYLYSEAAPQEIKQLAPAADILIMLRNPVEMLPSLHSQFVFVGIEPVEDFAAALALDEQRERDGAPRGFPPRSYRDAADYAPRVRRYLEAFGRDRVHVVVYDDFKEDTLGAVQGTYDFLGVDSSFRPRLDVVNPNTVVRNRSLRGLVRRPPERLRPLLHRISSQQARRRIGAAVKRWNTRAVPRDPVPDGIVESLRPLAVRQAGELEELLGRDFSRWRR